jgi:hypothetical protein
MIEGTSTSTPTTHTHVHVQIHIFIHVLHVFLFQPMHVNTILEYTLTVRCLHLTYTFVRWYCIILYTVPPVYTVYLTSHITSQPNNNPHQPTSVPPCFPCPDVFYPALAMFHKVLSLQNRTTSCTPARPVSVVQQQKVTLLSTSMSNSNDCSVPN